MIMILGAATVAGGAFLFLWYRIVVSLPVQKRPRFVHTPAFKWGVPALAGMLFLVGCILMARISVRYAVAAASMSGLFAFLLIYFDQYSANARLIYGHYKAVRTENPDLDEIEVLFETASWRYPDWGHDRLVAMVADKDIQTLILLMLITENKINPLTDWDLYRSLQTKVRRLVDDPGVLRSSTHARPSDS